MDTLIIKLPDALSRKIEQTGFTHEQLENVFIQFVESFLANAEQSSPKVMSVKWIGGSEFAQRVIKENRELFETLAKL